jgi:hypothetical protein
VTETRPTGTFVRTFVRQAWILLAFQLIAAAAAVVVTAWAAAQVRPLLVQRDELRTVVLGTQKQIAEAERRMAELNERELPRRPESGRWKRARPNYPSGFRALGRPPVPSRTPSMRFTERTMPAQS